METLFSLIFIALFLQMVFDTIILYILIKRTK
nr:MAG TPA: hypothetical protein [Caudoviricetes sp.]